MRKSYMSVSLIPIRFMGGNERARQSSTKKNYHGTSESGEKYGRKESRATSISYDDTTTHGDGGTSKEYSRLERGTFCNALFIICMPNPETLPTNIAVRPMFDFRRSNKSTTEASVNNNIQRLLLLLFCLGKKGN